MSHPVANLLRQLRTVLFTLEPLPMEQAETTHDRRSLLALVFAREHLPTEPEGPRRRSRWLSWLFLPERVDRDQSRTPVD